MNNEIIIKDRVAIEKMRRAGHKLAYVMSDIGTIVKDGISTLVIDGEIERRMRKEGMIPVCKGYHGYCHASCISLNDVIVHGVPREDIVLKDGDFVKIDVAASFDGYCADMTRYFFIGDVKPVVKRLAKVAQMALDAAINVAVAGNRLFDISRVIESIVESHGFNVVRDFGGHGIGRNLHEAPDILNYVPNGENPVLKAGMTLAIEPMIVEKNWKVKILDDGWTAKTADGGLAAHVEDTVLVLNGGSEVLTRL